MEGKFHVNDGAVAKVTLKAAGFVQRKPSRAYTQRKVERPYCSEMHRKGGKFHAKEARKSTWAVKGGKAVLLQSLLSRGASFMQRKPGRADLQ